MNLLSKLSGFFISENLDSENVEEQEISKQEVKEDLFKYIYEHDKLKIIFRNSI